jgi:peroxiredoxin Q/BCP
VAYFAISTDDAPTNKKFADSLSCDYPILADPERKVAEAYGVLMSDASHANRWTFYIGPDGKILDIDKKVKPQTAGPDLAAKLGSLEVKKRGGAPAKN